MSRWDGLRVTATLAAPVEGDHALHLDAMLTEAAFRSQPNGRDVSRATPTGELADISIPLQRIEARGIWLWASSAWMFSCDREQVLLPVVRRKDAEDVERLTVSWTPGSGPGRNLLQKPPGVVARSVSWLGIGWRQGVRKSLKMIESVGDRRRHGNGQVLAWHVEVVPEFAPVRCLVDDESRAVRHLPVAWCSRIDGEIAHGAIRGPYWHSGRHGPIVLPGARVTLHRDVMDAVGACE